MSSVIILTRHFTNCDAILELYYSKCLKNKFLPGTIKIKAHKQNMKHTINFKCEVSEELFFEIFNKYSTIETFSPDAVIKYIRESMKL